MLPNNDPPVSTKAHKFKDPEQVRRDLEQFLKLATDHGARQSCLVSGNQLVFDKSLAKFRNSEENPDNLSEHWPVRMPLDSLWDSIRSFRNGIFFTCPAPLGMPDLGQGPIVDAYYRQACLQLVSILTALESDAFYKGYHMAVGYGAGNCRFVLCHKEKRCQALVRARGCIHPFKARPSMKAVGLDASAMARKLQIPQTQDRVSLYGLVMIA
ncbi:MAG: hypothetical protein JEZ02_03220 [Desulfatibacillum sp.]|nr:hypothetical protein [Desulfatibacillum sp.]